MLSVIELIFNSRPLNQLWEDDTSNILTPNHLLFGHKLYQINPNFEHSYDEFEIDIPKRVKHVDNTIEHFWKASRICDVIERILETADTENPSSTKQKQFSFILFLYKQCQI